MQTSLQDPPWQISVNSSPWPEHDLQARSPVRLEGGLSGLGDWGNAHQYTVGVELGGSNTFSFGGKAPWMHGMTAMFCRIFYCLLRLDGWIKNRACCWGKHGIHMTWAGSIFWTTHAHPQGIASHRKDAPKPSTALRLPTGQASNSSSWWMSIPKRW